MSYTLCILFILSYHFIEPSKFMLILILKGLLSTTAKYYEPTSNRLPQQS